MPRGVGPWRKRTKRKLDPMHAPTKGWPVSKGMRRVCYLLLALATISGIIAIGCARRNADDEDPLIGVWWANGDREQLVFLGKHQGVEIRNGRSFRFFEWYRVEEGIKLELSSGNIEVAKPLITELGATLSFTPDEFPPYSQFKNHNYE